MATFQLPPAPGRFVEVQGQRLHYTELGPPDAPVLLAVHGLLASHTVWQRVQGALSERFRLIMLDLPGHGYSARDVRFSMTLPDQARAVAGFIEALGLGRVHVMGHSMGGAIGLILAADHGALVDKLVAIAAVSFPYEAPLKGRLGAVPGFGYVLVRYLYRRSILEAFLRDDVYHDPSRMPADELDTMYAHFNNPPSRQLAHRAIVRTQDPSPVTACLDRVQAPTLVLWGRQDALVPVALAGRLASALKDGKSHVFEDCGHVPMMEAPEGFSEQALAFLQAG